MMHLSPVGAKAQVTLPKDVRKALKIKEKNDFVGFIVEGNTVILTRIEPVASVDPYSEEEWSKIRALASKKPARVLHSSTESLGQLDRMLKKHS